MINSSITQSLRACITSVFRRSVQEKKKRKTFSEYWGATFNCLTTHVAKLSQLHPKHSAQTLAATGKLLGSSPNRCVTASPWKIWTPTSQSVWLKQRDETRRRGEEEENCSDLVCHLPAPETASLPIHSLSPQPHEKPTGLGSHLVKRQGCVCLDGLAS